MLREVLGQNKFSVVDLMMKLRFSHIGLCTAMILVASCTGGTTYGTGSSHEEQTIKSLSNMLAIAPDEKPDIDYSSRPDLVMPPNKGVLPTPVDETQVASEENWPVSPEQRIAAISEGAPEPDDYGNLPTEYLVSEKDGIRNSADIYRASRASDRSGGGEQLIDEIVRDSNGSGTSAEVQKRRSELAYSTGVQRKFLTEPPTEYRVPSENAEAGELGISKEQISEQQRRQDADRRNVDRGVLTPGGS